MRIILLIVLSLLVCACDDPQTISDTNSGEIHDADPATEARCFSVVAEGFESLCSRCPQLRTEVTGGACRELGDEFAYCGRVQAVTEATLATCTEWLARPGCTQSWDDAELWSCRTAWAVNFNRDDNH